MKPRFFTSRPACLIFAGIFLLGCIAAGCVVTGRGQPKENALRITPAEDVAFPAVTALAWLDSPGEYRFVSAAEDGAVRIWEVYSGRMVFDSRETEPRLSGASDTTPADAGQSAGSAGETPLSIEFNGEKITLLPFSKTENPSPVFSPDGTKHLSASGDGGILLTDASDGKELARYYALGDEWISISGEGFYNASFRGSSLLAAETSVRRYDLSRLSGALFRPDLFKALLLGEKTGAPVAAGDLLKDDFLPPLVSLSFEGDELSAKPSDMPGGQSGQDGPQNGQTGRLAADARRVNDTGSLHTLKITITEQKGGTGLLALYRRSEEGDDIPAGLFDVEKAAEKKYSEEGKTCYEIRLRLEHGPVGVSVFNTGSTVESERLWLTSPEFSASLDGAAGESLRAETDAPAGTGRQDSITAAASPNPPPVLRALIAGGESREYNAGLEEFLTLQEEGALYSGVKLKNLSGDEWSRTGFIKTMNELCTGLNNNDTFVLFLRGGFQTDDMGDFRLVTGKAGDAFEREISANDILEKVLVPGRDINFVLLLDLASGMPVEKIETALLRFRQRLGPKAVLAAFGTPDGCSFADSITGALGSEVLTPGAAVNSGNRYIHTAAFLARAGEVLAENGARFTAFPPREDFRLTDRFINTGELIFQTMASGMLKIDQIDKNPVPLNFGTKPSRILPSGRYIIDMIYRNGYRETRTVELRKKESAWVIFTYTPPLLAGDFSARLPSLGINTAELNPVNYQKINREAMEGMGMAPYYVAFLAGEKFYKEGNYDRAIAEYGRAISLRADYADAYASRGNAQRRKGDSAGALEDYNRALSLKNGYAEVYNYRGYIYARRGDQGRAIADYTQAIRYRANYVDAYFNRAFSYGEQGNWDRAIADYTEVINLEPSNAVAYNERGKAYYNKGETSQAAADYAAAEKLK